MMILLGYVYSTYTTSWSIISKLVFPFFSSFITSSPVFSILLGPPKIQVIHSLSLHHKKNPFSPFYVTKLSFFFSLSLFAAGSLSNYPFILPPPPIAPTRALFNQFKVYSFPPYIYLLFAWLIYGFFRVRVLGFSLGFFYWFCLN